MSTPAGTVTAWRETGAGPVAETVHRVHVAVVAPDGTLLASAGDAAYRTPTRSCSKPIQAQAMFLSGAVDRFGVTYEELALACASHEGAPLHTERVSAFLARMGVGVADLMCGAHAPSDADGRAQLGDDAPTNVHNNCSGKHSGMLATALALGVPTKDYLRSAHPVQGLVREVYAAMLPGLEAQWAVDGCSLPTPILTVRDIATLYARLAAPPAWLAEYAEGRLAYGLSQAFDAMAAHPELVGGRAVLDTRIMRSLLGVVAKRGADGGYAMAVRATPERPAMGIAIKVETGSEEARAPAVMAVLDALGMLNPATRHALKDVIRPPRKNHRGLVVGHWEAALGLAGPIVKAG